MSGASNDDCGSDDRSSSLEEASSDQRCQSGELTEWRSCEQVENGTPSTSPPYWDTDDDDDIGPKPSELYGKFTWKIENFTQISKRELRSNAFEVGGYKWYILIYPQGCDVCNHLSLFLCVANHDKHLPGWSHFAQFTIAVVNKDPKKSKYSDTLHRFWKKEHDWGWKKFMELSKVLDGFIVSDALVIKAQVQVIREKTHRPFRCLDCQYRRELVRVYLSNVEMICRKFVEERRSKLSKLIEDKVRWSSFCDFWSGVDKNSRHLMSSDKMEAILKIVVKHFFIEKEVTSTLVMDSLYSGLKVLESQSKNNKGRGSSALLDEMPVPMVYIEKDMFVLANDALVLLERAAIELMPPKDDKGSQNQSTNLNRTKDGNSSEEFNKDSIERDERRLTELGCRTVEIFVLTHIFSSRIEVAYQEAVALRRQEELIREEEAAWQAEELKAKRGATEKEKKSKKKHTKQKRTNRKGKDKARDEKPDLVVLNRQDESQRHSPSVERLSECYLQKEVETIIEKVEITEDISDVSDTLDDTVEALQHDLEDRDGNPINWDTEESEVSPATEVSSNKVKNEQMEKMNPSIVDDSSSTCSTDSVLSVGINGQHMGNAFQINKGPRGRYPHGQATREQTCQIQDADNVPSDYTAESNVSQDLANISGANPPDSRDVISDHTEYMDQNIVEKEKEVVPSQKKLGDMNEVDSEKSIKQTLVVELAAATGLLRSHASSHQMTCPMDPSSNNNQANKLVSGVTKPVQVASILKPEMQVSTSTVKVTAAQQASPVSRPLSAPVTPGPRPTTPLVLTVQTMPLLSRSVSAAGRLGINETSTHGYAPQSYRNAIIGKSTMGPSSAGIVPCTSIGSSTQGGTHSQPSTAFIPSSSTASHQISPRKDNNSARSGFCFRPVIQEASIGGNRWTEHSSVQEASSSGVSRSSDIIHDTARLNLQDVSRRHTEIGSGSSVRLTQGANSYEFPHLDLINYLLDEDQVTEKASENDQNQHLMNRQFTFPGSSGSLELGISNGLNRFDAHYYDETMQRALYGSPSEPFDARIDLMQPQLDTSIYANGQIDGLLLNQWPSGGTDHSMHSMDPADIHRYSYQIPDYSGLSRGFNAYGFYRPANGR